MRVNFRTVALGTVAYAVCTFPLAVIWHVVLFGEQYEAFGYFEGEPSFALGLLTIVIQGAALSALYVRVSFSGDAVWRGLKFAALAGLFFWTSHVLAFAVKQQIAGAGLFILMETGYLTLQFGAFGILIGAIHKPDNG